MHYPQTETETTYLPMTRTAAVGFLSTGAVPVSVIERAGLYVLLVLTGSTPPNRFQIDNALTDADRLFSNTPEGEVAQFLLDQRRDSHAGMADTIDGLLERQGIVFASDAAMVKRAWCGADGRYTPAFQARCRNTMSDFQVSMAKAPSSPLPSSETDAAKIEQDEISDGLEEDADTFVRMPRQSVRLHGTTDQARAASIIAAAPDEHYDLAAYAGSGKTHLVFELGSRMRQWTHLAPTAAHRFSFQRRFGNQKAPSFVMAGLAVRMVADQVKKQGHSTWVRPPTLTTSTRSLAQKAEVAGIPAIGAHSPAKVMLLVEDAIRRWCLSDRSAITIEDLPGLNILPAERPAIVAHARNVWDRMFEPRKVSADEPFHIRAYHLVKWLDLARAEIPPMGVLMVDEAHDLSPAWMALLDRYADGVVLMGDPYQRLDGRPPRLERVKAIAMTQSVRTGEQAMPLIESVIDMHADRLMPDTIRGSRDHMTRVQTYRTPSETPDAGLRVYGTEWQLLADALRMKDAGASFQILPASSKVMWHSVVDAIGLFMEKMHDKAPSPRSQYHLASFTNWDSLAAHLVTIGQDAVVRLIERGFTVAHAQVLMKAASVKEEEPEASITLALLEHTKNLEDDVVVMSPCCFSSVSNRRFGRIREKLLKSVYLAMTRVRSELWVPGDALDRLVDQVR